MTDQSTTAYDSLPENLRELPEAQLHFVHPQERTRLFHEIFGAPVYDQSPDRTFSHMDDQRVAFRVSFMLSELFELIEKGLGLHVHLTLTGDVAGELFQASGSDNAQLSKAVLEALLSTGRENRDLIEVVDGLGDLNVVVNGFALELGVDMQSVDQEILASNLTKLDANGHPIVADGSDPRYPAGKILKGPNYIEPQIGLLLGFDD